MGFQLVKKKNGRAMKLDLFPLYPQSKGALQSDTLLSTHSQSPGKRRTSEVNSRWRRPEQEVAEDSP
jgi:hypothetical protein